MKKTYRSAVIMSVVFGFSHIALADNDDRAPWRPENAAAISITGPIIVERKSLEVGKARFTMHLDSSQAAFKSGQDRFPAHIYAVTRMSNPILQNGQTLCGDNPPTWIVVVPQPPLGLELDVFTGVDRPTSTSSPGLCNTLVYTR
ncbi:MAG TPA: hypothetical protein VMF58_02645 [Rhizomicrobium sp.]|nr:hypothetical protein [Rhizomicrobium sp.]